MITVTRVNAQGHCCWQHWLFTRLQMSDAQREQVRRLASCPGRWNRWKDWHAVFMSSVPGVCLRSALRDTRRSLRNTVSKPVTQVSSVQPGLSCLSRLLPASMTRHHRPERRVWEIFAYFQKKATLFPPFSIFFTISTLNPQSLSPLG